MGNHLPGAGPNLGAPKHSSITGVTVPGLEPTIAKSPDFGTATELMIYVSGPDSSEWVSMAGFQLPPNGIPEGRWLHWDGEITEYGCPG